MHQVFLVKAFNVMAVVDSTSAYARFHSGVSVIVPGEHRANAFVPEISLTVGYRHFVTSPTISALSNTQGQKLLPNGPGVIVQTVRANRMFVLLIVFRIDTISIKGRVA